MIEIKSRFTGAVIRTVDALSGANLRGADLYGADLYGADLRGANLYGATLCYTGGVIDLGTPNGWISFAWMREGSLSIRVGCKEKRPRDALKYWANKEHRREVLAAVHYAIAVAKARDWRIHPKKRK